MSMQFDRETRPARLYSGHVTKLDFRHFLVHFAGHCTVCLSELLGFSRLYCGLVDLSRHVCFGPEEGSILAAGLATNRGRQEWGCTDCMVSKQ